MRNRGLRAGLLLAGVILVAAAGACQTYAYFSSMTSMFTDVPAPTFSHAQAPGLKTNDFLWESLSTVPGVNVKETTVNNLNSPTTQDHLFNFYLNSAPETSSNSGWLYTTMTPGIDMNNDPAKSDYTSMVKRYTNNSWNVFDD